MVTPFTGQLARHTQYPQSNRKWPCEPTVGLRCGHRHVPCVRSAGSVGPGGGRAGRAAAGGRRHGHIGEGSGVCRWAVLLLYDQLRIPAHGGEGFCAPKEDARRPASFHGTLLRLFFMGTFPPGCHSDVLATWWKVLPIPVLCLWLRELTGGFGFW